MARKSRGCAEAYMGTASRSVGTWMCHRRRLNLYAPRGGSHRPRAEKDPFRMETS